MIKEILNMQELTSIIESASVTEGHSDLKDALLSRYPEYRFHLVAERDGRTWNPGIIDQQGNRLTDDLVKWIDQIGRASCRERV